MAVADNGEVRDGINQQYLPNLEFSNLLLNSCVIVDSNGSNGLTCVYFFGMVLYFSLLLGCMLVKCVTGLWVGLQWKRPAGDRQQWEPADTMSLSCTARPLCTAGKSRKTFEKKKIF